MPLRSILPRSICRHRFHRRAQQGKAFYLCESDLGSRAQVKRQPFSVHAVGLPYGFSSHTPCIFLARAYFNLSYDLPESPEEPSQISDDYYYVAAAYTNENECGDAFPLAQRGLALFQVATGQPHWTQTNFTALLTNCHASS